MKPEIVRLIEKAKDCLDSADLNLREGFYDAAVNRSYYGVFDIVTALLLFKDVTVKSHSGAIQQFAQFYIKAGTFEIEFQEILVYCFQKRQQSDYDFYSDISREEASATLLKEKKFVASGIVWLEEQNHDF